jgi:hypothetical protein
VAVAFCILAVVGVGAALSTNYGLPWPVFFKALQFKAFTLMLYGVWIANQRSLWKERVFWILTTLSLLVHTLAFAVVLSRFANFKPVWFAMIGFAEILLMLACKSLLIPRGAKSRSRVLP